MTYSKRDGRIHRGEYWYIKKWEHPNCGIQGYVAEHRLVMEKHVGRFLKPTEVVHHINHNPSDNRLENLQLFSSHGQHTKYAHPEIYEKQRGITVYKDKCHFCGNLFDKTWMNRRSITCSQKCKHKLIGKKLKGRKATKLQLKGLAHGWGWNRGLPMTWQKTGKESHRYKHGKYCKPTVI